MDTDQNLQPFSSQPNGKPRLSLSQVPPAEPDDNSGQQVDLGWVFAVVRRRAFVMGGVALTLIIISALWLIWNKRQTILEYQGSFKLLVEPVTAEDRLRNQFLRSQSQSVDIERIEVNRSNLLDYETQIRVLLSPKIMEPIIKKLQQQYPEINYNSLKDSLSIERLSYEKDGKEEGTKIIEVKYHHKDTEQILFVLGTVANTYLEYSLEERQKSLTQGITFIDTQLPSLQQQVDSIQGQLQNIRQQYNLVDPEEAELRLSQHALGISKDRLVTEVQLAETKALYETLQKQFVEENPTAILSRESQAYGTLLSQLQTIEAQLASESAQFREDSPPMEILREKQQNLRVLLNQQSQDILENLAGEIQGLEERYSTIIKTENQVNQKLEQLPTVTRQIADLQRKLDIATDNLKEFLSKRESLRLDAAQQEIPWEMISPPELWRTANGNPLPVEALSLRRPFAIAVVLSGLLGIGVGFLVEILHTVFHTPEEIQGQTKLPILGVIPLTKDLRKRSKKLKQRAKQRASAAKIPSLVAAGEPGLMANRDTRGDKYSTSPLMEAFRSLYTTIRLLHAKKRIHSLAISSAIPGDGKTTVAIYLAETAAKIGQRVLLVDTDLRVPQLHNQLDLPNTQGLSDVIALNVPIDDAIQTSCVDDKFFVLTAGQTLSDPIKLLSSDKMHHLMEQFSVQFDLVIYDTPPLLGLGDGNLLAAKADGSLLVVGIEKTNRSLVMKAVDGLKIADASILGIVANGAKVEAKASYTSASSRRQTSRY
ncbi:GumC family protein [Coleofasciculus sp. G2-EDA-02]|uniref:GumC family protein n=1 Tax=Coleofasciculus sp. G2-EDA-02 TaxID=3069529 RepID=UPI0032FA4645